MFIFAKSINNKLDAVLCQKSLLIENHYFTSEWIIRFNNNKVSVQYGKIDNFVPLTKSDISKSIKESSLFLKQKKIQLENDNKKKAQLILF